MYCNSKRPPAVEILRTALTLLTVLVKPLSFAGMASALLTDLTASLLMPAQLVNLSSALIICAVKPRMNARSFLIAPLVLSDAAMAPAEGSPRIVIIPSVL